MGRGWQCECIVRVRPLREVPTLHSAHGPSSNAWRLRLGVRDSSGWHIGHGIGPESGAVDNAVSGEDDSVSLKANVNTDRNGRVTVGHAECCPVNTATWLDCNCGLFQGFDKPLAHGGNHKESCPCHCTCDFMNQLQRVVEVREP